MFITVDCAKLNDDKVILYEFYNRNVDSHNVLYYQEKLEKLRSLVEIVYLIEYSTNQINTVTNIKITKFESGRNPYIVFDNVDFNEFRQWYLEQNGAVRNFRYSKEFGIIKNTGDEYVETILTKLVGCNLTSDNNGRELIIPALAGIHTHFFDFDLLNTKSGFNIEFLKNESHIKKRQGKQKWDLSNSATHPNRYWRQNKMEFLTLWEACKIVRSDLYLLSYSEDINEDLHLMKVLNLDEDGIKHDIGFKIKYNAFIEWLKEMDKGVINDIDYLKQHSNSWRERDEVFWSEEEYWKSELKKF